MCCVSFFYEIVRRAHGADFFLIDDVLVQEDPIVMTPSDSRLVSVVSIKNIIEILTQDRL